MSSPRHEDPVEVSEPNPITVRPALGAAMLATSVRQFWQFLESGAIPSFTLRGEGSRCRLILVDDLRKWAQQRAAEARSSTSVPPSVPPTSDAPGSAVRVNVGVRGDEP